MIVFWTVVAIMLVVPMAYLAPAILGKTKQRDQDRQQQNVAIAKEQLRVLEADMAAGTITESEFEQTRMEIERALHHDVVDNQEEDVAKEPTGTEPKMVWLLFLLGIPLISIPLYYQLGSPQLADPAKVAKAKSHSQSAQKQPGQFDLTTAAANLAKKLEQNPEDAEGWFLLGQTYMALKDYPGAVDAFSHSYRITSDDPRVMLRYADAIAMTQNGKIQGLPFDLVKKAIKLAPSEPTALWLVGIGYAEAEDFKQALHYWELLLPLVSSDPASKQKVEGLVLFAKQKLGQTVTPTEPQVATTKASIQLLVSISPELAQKVSPDEVIFIFARAVSGPRMPLAAIRKQVKDLPVSVTLDDSQAMQPQFRLSLFPQVLVGARISRSGNPVASAGDFYGEYSPVTPAEQPQLKIEINKVVQ